jgi:hypothetical protein
MIVHHMAAAGTLDQISYTACGIPFPGVPVEQVTAVFALATCPECKRRGPRKIEPDTWPESTGSEIRRTWRDKRWRLWAECS